MNDLNKIRETNKISVIVVNDNTLGTLAPNSDCFVPLAGKVNSLWGDRSEPVPTYMASSIRLATLNDLEEYRVSEDNFNEEYKLELI